MLAGGFALSATGNTEDPVASMTDIVDMRQMLAESELDAAAIPIDEGIDSELELPAMAPAVPSSTMTWSAINEVLYDLWYLVAATVALILVSQLLGWLLRQVPRKQTVPADRSSSDEDEYSSAQ